MSSTRALRRATVLAVDDKPANLVALEAVLGSEHDVVQATSGEEAVAIMQKRTDIDVILMDVQMPGMDGFEAATRIKRIERARDVPIIFITAIYRDDPFVKKGYDVGAIDYFGKPFDPDILRTKVGIYGSFRRREELLRERERQLAESEELLRVGRRLSSVLENLPVGVLVADVHGSIIQTNEEVARICKATDPMKRDAYGEILGWWDASGRLIKGHDGLLARALHDRATSCNEVMEIECCDGSSKAVLGSASPLLGLDDAVVGAVVVIQDMTETKRFEADLEQRIARLFTLGVELEHTARH